MPEPHSRTETPSFSEQADQPTPSLLAELLDFLRTNQKWWLLPILFVLGLVGVLIVLGSSSLAPFIYPLF